MIEIRDCEKTEVRQNKPRWSKCSVAIAQKFINVVVQPADVVVIDPNKGVQFTVLVEVADKNCSRTFIIGQFTAKAHRRGLPKSTVSITQKNRQSLASLAH